MKYNVIMNTCKKPSLDCSEDVVGESNGFYWLLDGATPPLGELNHKHTKLFVDEMSKALTRNAVFSKNTKELLYKSLVDIKNIFEANGLDRYDYLPYSTAIIVKVCTTYIEYSVLGDSFLGIRVNDNETIVTDDRLKKIAVNERKLVRRLRENNGEKDNNYLLARKELILTEKRYQNMKDGYWVAALQPEAANHSISGKINITPSDNIMIVLVSDGLERLVSTFAKYKNICTIADDILAKGEKHIFNMLRELEKDNNNFKKPVSSTNDDASYVIITPK